MTWARDGWRLVVPVKEAGRAKTRLRPPQPVARPDLARALARDTLEAACAGVGAGQVLVVTSDAPAAAAARRLGAPVLADPGTGLDGAVRAGRDHWAAAGPPAPVGVLLGDLPALRPKDLAAALAACAAHPAAVVPDADGTGTVLLTARPGTALRPAFGPGSADRHAAWARVLPLDLPRLRTDVDDASALQAAVRLGLGRHTAAALGGPSRHRSA